MNMKKLLFLLFLVILLFCSIELSKSFKIVLITLCIILEAGMYSVFFKPQTKSVIILSIMLCFIATMKMVFDVITIVNGRNEMINEFNKILKFSLFNFIAVMVICAVGNLIKKGRVERYEKNG